MNSNIRIIAIFIVTALHRGPRCHVIGHDTAWDSTGELQASTCCCTNQGSNVCLQRLVLCRLKVRGRHVVHLDSTKRYGNRGCALCYTIFRGPWGMLAPIFASIMRGCDYQGHDLSTKIPEIGQLVYKMEHSVSVLWCLTRRRWNWGRKGQTVM